MDKVTTLGIDLAKNTFSLHGVDAMGKEVMRRTVSRARLMTVISQMPPCLIGMEACSGAHDWARRFQALGHTVRIMAAKFVTPYRRSGKNDGNDAEAICEAVQRPSMRFVPIKSEEQQAILTVHRVRQGFIEERTGTINRIRGLMSEFGLVLPTRAAEVKRGARDAADALPAMARAAIEDLMSHLAILDERIAALDRQLEAVARSDETVKRLMTIPGVGPLSALATVATVGHGEAWGPLPANLACHGCQSGSADGRQSRRQAQPLGRGIEGATRLSPRRCGPRRQECSHHLGAARAALGLQTGLAQFKRFNHALVEGCTSGRKQVRPTPGEPDQ